MFVLTFVADMTEPSAPVITYAPPGAARRLRSLADMRGVWSLGDQAILSLGNFLTNWLLLRCQAVWYGNYYTILTVIIFLNNLHLALVTYPISVTSAGITESELRRRIRRAIGMTLLLAIPESLAIGLGTVITTHRWTVVPWAIAALVFWQLQETVRRALMARLENRRAIAGDFVAYLVQAAAIWFVIHRGTISIEYAFGVIAFTSVAAALIQAMQLRLHVPSTCAPVHTALQQARHHFKLGQWILLANVVNLLTIYSIPWMIRYTQGPAGVAMYSAVLLVLNASNALVFAVSNLITPVVAKAKTESEARGESGAHETQAVALKYALQGSMLLFPFFAFLILFPALPLHLIYKAGSPYLQLTGPMRIFAVAYGMMYVSIVLNSYLCGLGKSRAPFLAQIANAVATCLITLPLVARFGIIGAAWGSLFPVLAQLLVGAYFVYRVRFDVRESVMAYSHGFPMNGAGASMSPPQDAPVLSR
jgi:O-antigen/teichoic acid export membrane protein